MADILMLHGITGPAAQGVADTPSSNLIAGPNIHAIVSKVPKAVAAKDMDAETAARLVMRHHALLQGHFAATPVLPIQFGAFFSNADAVNDALRTHAVAFQDALKAINDLEEYQLQLVARRPGTAAQPSPQNGREHLKLKRQRREGQKAQAIQQAAFARRVYEHVGSLSAKVTDARQGNGTGILLNLVILMRRREVPAFMSSIDDMQGCAKSCQTDLKIKGPYPPYSYDFTFDTERRETCHVH